MQYKNYTDPIINNFRRDEQGVKQSKRIDSESHKIVNGKVALSELPDEEQVLSIEGYKEIKIEDAKLEDKQFRVDYTNGFIYFSPSQDGATVDVAYFGLGVTYFPASRVWLEVDGENNVKKTLGDLQGDIEEAKKLSESQEQLKKDLDEQGGKLKNIIDEVQKVDLTEIENTVNNVKQTENDLKTATSEAEAKIANVNETKKQLETTIQSAKDEGQTLDSKIEQSKVNKADIDSACEKLNQAKGAVDGSVKQANDSIATIDEKVNTGNQVKSELDNSIQQANDVNSTLSNTKQEATQANSELIASQKTADKTKSDLEALKSESTSLSTDLGEKSAEAKQNIDSLTSQNNQAKDNIAELQNESKTAIEKKDSLLSENTKASQTIEQIETLIQSSTDLKNRLEEIIASGDLGKYVTDPKLQNILTSYATKDDLSKIDLTEKLTEYAKTVDVNKQVASLTNLIDNKVDKVDGYGLSKNDYTDVDKAKVKAIPDNPKYTDTVPDLSGYATKSSIPTSLSQLADDETHRLISDDEKEKLKNIESEANKYVHPNTHSASMITETTDKRFVSDDEKEKWNNPPIPDLSDYVQKDGSKVLSTNDYTDEDKAKVDAIPADAKYTDTVPDLSGYAKTIDIPSKVSQLENDIEYQSISDVESTIHNSRIQQSKANGSSTTSHPVGLSFYSSINGLVGAPFIIFTTLSYRKDNIRAVQQYAIGLSDAKIHYRSSNKGPYHLDLKDNTVSVEEWELWREYETQNANMADLELKPDKSSIPTSLSQLSEDATHRLVSDTEKTTWNNKVDTSKIITDNKTFESLGLSEADQKKYIPSYSFLSEMFTEFFNLLSSGIGQLVQANIPSDYKKSKILTKSEYDAISNKDPNTLYFIKK